MESIALSIKIVVFAKLDHVVKKSTEKPDVINTIHNDSTLIKEKVEDKLRGV